MKTSLTKSQAKERDELVKVVKDGMDTVVKVRKALVHLHSKKLWRDTHKSWSAFCKDHFPQYTREHVYRLIEDQKVIEKVSDNLTDSEPPKSGSQARELSKVDDPQEVWEQTQAKTGKSQPSAKEVRETAEQAALRQARVKIAKADPSTDEEIHDGRWKPTDEELLMLADMKPGEIVDRMKRRRIGQSWKPAPEVDPVPGNVHSMHEQGEPEPEVPEHLADAFARGDRLRAIIKQAIPNIQSELWQHHDWLYDGERNPAMLPKGKQFSIHHLQPLFDQIVSLTQKVAPKEVCSSCDGAGGGCCRGRGWTA